MNRYNLRSKVEKVVQEKPTIVVPEQDECTKIPEKTKQNDYLNKDNVVLEDVDEDGACLYECLARGLSYANPELVVDKKTLMNLSREYIYVHQNRSIPLPNNISMTFKELVEMTHEMDIETYYKRYKKMTTRNWGGLPEIIAISELFLTEISIYTEDEFGYKRNYTIPVQSNELYKKSIRLLLDIYNDNPHYNVMIY